MRVGRAGIVMIAQLIVAGIAIAVVAFFVTMWRWSRVEAAKADVALEAFAAGIGATTTDWQRTRTLSGTIDGRPCTVEEGRIDRQDESDDYYVRITMPVRTAVAFELHRQMSSLGAGLVGDVELGDPDFDRQVILRTSDRELARRALPPESRPAIVEWVKTGRLQRIYVKDGQLHYEGGHGLHQASHFPVAREMVDFVARIASALEQQGVA